MTVQLLLKELTNQGITLWVDGEGLRYRAPIGQFTADIRTRIAEMKTELIAELTSTCDLDARLFPLQPQAAYDPFPLTDLQQAYCGGVSELYALSTPAFAYREFDVETLDLRRLIAALKQVVMRHDMLRVRVGSDGRQVCSPPGGRAEHIGYADLRNLASQEIEARLEAKRQSAARDIPSLDSGAPFYCFVHQLPSSYRVHLAFRLFAVDAESIGILLQDLVRAYEGESLGGTCSSRHVFREYVNGLAAYRSSANYKRSIQYWKKRALTLLPSPELPVASVAGLPVESRFDQRRYHLSQPLWQAFRAKAARHQISFNVALCAVYADVLALWSGGKS